MILPFAPRHAAGVLHVIGTVFREYGATFEPSGFDADLTDIVGRYVRRGGCFVVLEDGGRVVGTAAVVPHYGATCEVKRVYLLPEYRGQGHGRALLEHVLGWAERAGYLVALAWSDARFATAHAVYDRMRFVRFGERTVDDADRSHELGFKKRLCPAVLATADDPTGACVLCHIASGDIKADRIVRTERVVAFVNDVDPWSRGHCIVFPRRHVPALHDTSDRDLAATIGAVKRLARALALEHYNVLQNNGELAGQTVFHVHVHLIPRWNHDEGLPLEGRRPAHVDQRAIAARLRARLRRARR